MASESCIAGFDEAIASERRDRSIAFTGLPELINGRIQKTSAKELISEVSKGGPETEDFLKFLSTFVPSLYSDGEKKIEAEDILPILFLLQLDYYSKYMKEFQVLVVFVEEDGAPEEIVVIEADPDKGFVTEGNINVLKKSGITLKVTSSNRAEIYKFNRKIGRAHV